jgi:CubicO group peptidase (beta-lactamase class C family)
MSTSAIVNLRHAELDDLCALPSRGRCWQPTGSAGCDQVPAECKTADSFFPGFWDGMGWGFGVAVKTKGPQRGRIGWSGGQGTDFFVDPDGTVGILLTQVEMGENMWPLVDQFQSLHEPA